jgi:hypothetical protein
MKKEVKYKLGDTVEIIAQECGHRFPIGHIGKITLVKTYGAYCVDEGKRNNVVSSEIRLVKPRTPKKPVLKVGDRVLYEGREAVILDIHEGDILVGFKDDSGMPICTHSSRATGYKSYYHVGLKDLEPLKKRGRPKKVSPGLGEILAKHNEPSMMVEVTRTNHIEVQEGERVIIFSFEGDKCVKISSTLPYKKNKDDWSFYARAILKALEQI